MNHTNEGSKLYLYSITSVAILGGLLFGYDTAVISGAEKGLEAFFLTATDFQYDKVMHGITSCTDRLRLGWCIVRHLRFTAGTPQLTTAGRRTFLPFGTGVLLS